MQLCYAIYERKVPLIDDLMFSDSTGQQNMHSAWQNLIIIIDDCLKSRKH